jgi:phosphoserine phosphatase
VISEPKHPLVVSITDQLSKRSVKRKQAKAVFDADGTLWSVDMGEEFLQLLAQQSSYANIYDTYQKMRWGGLKKEALIYAAQVVHGMTPKEVLTLADQHFQSSLRQKVFPIMRQLLMELSKLDFALYVVSASPRWAVIPGALHLGIPEQNVFGLETSLENGRYTKELATTYTSGAGKAEALRKARVENILFAAGNSIDDLHLLQASEGLKLCLSSAPMNTPLAESEASLAAHASQQGDNWIQLRLHV